jgi:hypothetical protein
MNDVIVHRVRRHDQIADVLRVGGNFELQSVLDRTHRRDRVNRRADAAKALREQPRVARVAADENPLDAAEHLPRRPRLLHDAAINFDVDS